MPQPLLSPKSGWSDSNHACDTSPKWRSTHSPRQLASAGGGVASELDAMKPGLLTHCAVVRGERDEEPVIGAARRADRDTDSTEEGVWTLDNSYVPRACSIAMPGSGSKTSAAAANDNHKSDHEHAALTPPGYGTDKRRSADEACLTDKGHGECAEDDNRTPLFGLRGDPEAHSISRISVRYCCSHIQFIIKYIHVYMHIYIPSRTCICRHVSMYMHTHVYTYIPAHSHIHT
jgi:hypothetical protein